MADKVQKPKKSKPKPKRGEQGVLAALPATRPERIGTRRVSAPETFEDVAQAAAATGQAKPAATGRAKPAAKSPARARTAAARAAAKRSPAKPAAARKPATATRRKAAAPRTFEPTQAAEAAAGAAGERAVGAVPRAAGAVPRAAAPRPAPEPRPRPVREGAPGMGTRDSRAQPAPEHGRPSGVELVATAVKAAGELTQFGLTIGGRIIKRAVDKLPKP